MGLERYVVDEKRRPTEIAKAYGISRSTLTIDPTRDYQPLNGCWPVHNVMRQASAMS